MTRGATLRWAAVVALALVGCHSRTKQGDPVRFAKTFPSPPPGNNWSLPPQEAEQLFATAPAELVSLKRTSTGVAGAYKAEIVFEGDGRHVDVKWKEVPRGSMDGWNNNPRKELAAYEVQKWFLEPKDYVVPTVALRCIPIDRYRRLAPQATSTLKDTKCVLGELSLWLQHVEVPDVLYDPERFATDSYYAYHHSNFNVFAYLVEHRDGRAGNILVADDAADRRVFSVDNGISFGAFIYNFLVPNWNLIRVPAIRREVVEQLRRLPRSELDALGTLVELRVDDAGILRPVEASANMGPDRGVRVGPGRVQMGLTRDEIDAVAHRIAVLVHRVDTGELPVF